MSISSPPEPDRGEGQALPAIDMAAVARVSTQAELRAIRLGFLHADIDERRGEIPSDWSAHAIMGLNVAADLDRDSRRRNLRCGFLAMYFPGTEPDNIETLPSPKDAPFELHAAFRLAYEIRDVDGIQDTDPQQFAIVNGVLHAWPYWREIAQSTTVRMGLAPLLVGTQKVPWTGDPKSRSDQPNLGSGSPQD